MIPIRAQLTVDRTRAQSVYFNAFYLLLNISSEPITEPDNNKTSPKHSTNKKGEGPKQLVVGVDLNNRPRRPLFKVFLYIVVRKHQCSTSANGFKKTPMDP